MVKINRHLNAYTHLREINKNLQKELSLADSLCLYWKRVSEKADTMYFSEKQKYEQLTRTNTALQYAIIEEKKKSRKTGIGVGVGGVLLGFVLGVLLSK